jgi:hypothetical protein
VYLVDDLVPAGRWGYHLTVRATALEARAEVVAAEPDS